MQINKNIVLSTLLMIICLSVTATAQTTVTDEEVKTQLKMVNEIEFLRNSNKLLSDTKLNLESTVKLQTSVIELKDKQLSLLLEVVSQYEKLREAYVAQIDFQKTVIENDRDIIKNQSAISKKSKILDSIKSVFLALLGVVVGRVGI